MIVYYFIILILHYFQHVRMEFLAIFQALVLVFSQCYEFKGLSALQDADIEADFFENIKHVQVCFFFNLKQLTICNVSRIFLLQM